MKFLLGLIIGMIIGIIFMERQVCIDVNDEQKRNAVELI